MFKHFIFKQNTCVKKWIVFCAMPTEKVNKNTKETLKAGTMSCPVNINYVRPQLLSFI